jgi:hypothetical protein
LILFIHYTNCANDTPPQIDDLHHCLDNESHTNLLENKAIMLKCFQKRITAVILSAATSNENISLSCLNSKQEESNVFY